MEIHWAIRKCAAGLPPWTCRAVTSSWEPGFSRPYSFGQTAHTCQRMADEFATSVGYSAASAFIDLTEAFEHIQFHHLWRMVVTDGFPLRLLWFLIGVYGGPRVESGGSLVVAGCVHATTLMKLALVDSVDHTLKQLPSLFAAG